MNQKKIETEELSKDLYNVLINDNESYIQNPLLPTVYLSIELFHTCNYDCSYCYITPEGHRSKKEIDYKKLFWFLEKRFIPTINKNIYQKLKEYNNQSKKIEIVLLGGELSIKSLEWNLDFIKRLRDLFKDFDLQIVYLTNLFREAEYYIAFKQLEIENCKLMIFSTYHPEYQNFGDFIDKVLKIFKSNLGIELQYFGVKKDMYENFNEYKEKIDYCFDNELIRLSSIDHFLYKEFLEKYKKDLRPVNCYAYSYKISHKLEIKHPCKKQKFSFFDFNPKRFYVCYNTCSCSIMENEFRKELILKG